MKNWTKICSPVDHVNILYSICVCCKECVEPYCVDVTKALRDCDFDLNYTNWAVVSGKTKLNYINVGRFTECV